MDSINLFWINYFSKVVVYFWINVMVTLPETNSSHLPGSHPKRKLVTSLPYHPFSGAQAVSFRESIPQKHTLPMLFGSHFFLYLQIFRKIAQHVWKIAQFQGEPKKSQGVDHNSAFGMSSGSDSLQKLSNGEMPQLDRRSPLTNLYWILMCWWTKPWGK